MGVETFTATIALIGIVILVASLLSGLVERTGAMLHQDLPAVQRHTCRLRGGGAGTFLDEE